MTQVKDLPPDRRERRPVTREDYIRIIGETFAGKGNDWNKEMQAEFCGEVGVFVEWRYAPNTGLKRVLNHLAKYRMVLFHD